MTPIRTRHLLSMLLLLLSAGSVPVGSLRVLSDLSTPCVLCDADTAASNARALTAAVTGTSPPRKLRVDLCRLPLAPLATLFHDPPGTLAVAVATLQHARQLLARSDRGAFADVLIVQPTVGRPNVAGVAALAQANPAVRLAVVVSTTEHVTQLAAAAERREVQLYVRVGVTDGTAFGVPTPTTDDAGAHAAAVAAVSTLMAVLHEHRQWLVLDGAHVEGTGAADVVHFLHETCPGAAADGVSVGDSVPALVLPLLETMVPVELRLGVEWALGLGEAVAWVTSPNPTVGEELSRSSTSNAAFVHASVLCSAARDTSDAVMGSGRAQVQAVVDVGTQTIGVQQPLATASSGDSAAPAYLSLGLANHVAGPYFWGKGLGVGASMAAPGVLYQPAGDGSTGLLMRDTGANTNDGKRSEWLDATRPGDTVQLVPRDPAAAARGCGSVVAVRREGQPKGAEPAVDDVWTVLGAESAAS